MRDLRLKRKRFIENVETYKLFYKSSPQQDYIINSSGILNFIWNSWNNFWRDYWLAHINGGYYFDRSRLNKHFPNYNDKQSCHFLCHLSGKIKNHNVGDALVGSHQEITWGDYDKIIDIATKLSSIQPTNTHLQILPTILASYQTEIQHFQKIRNSFIHLNNEKMFDLNNIQSYYIFRSGQKNIEILDAVNMVSNLNCFDHLTSHISGVVTNL